MTNNKSYGTCNVLKTLKISQENLTTYTFDNNGNQRTEQSPGGSVTTNIWDYENRLINTEQPGVDNLTFAYDPNGLRTSKKQRATETKFIWDDQIYLLETDGSDTTTAVFTNEPSTYGSLINQRKSSNTNTFHFDGLESSRELTALDESITDTMIYSSFGEEINRTGATDVDFGFLGFQGYYEDQESGHTYIRARHFNPSNARFLSEDPLHLTPNLNMYRYCANNPVLFNDPSGLFCDDECCPVNKQRCVGPANFTLWPAIHGNPNAAEAAEAIAAITALLAKLACKLPGGKAGGKKAAKLYKKAIEAVLKAAKNLRDKLRKHGVAIWVKVGADCCTKQSCYILWSQNVWKHKDTDWIRCHEMGRGRAIGFDINDTRGMAKALETCLDREIKKFSCKKL